VKDDSTNNENKNEQTSNLTYMVYQLKHRIVELERQLQISKNTKKVVESCPMCKQGSGFSLVGFPLIKCIEHTLSLYVGFHNFPVFGSFLLMFLQFLQNRQLPKVLIMRNANGTYEIKTRIDERGPI
jgi:hypothetical protein